ncbi:hypothetical protein UCRPC4_g00054 [Phaeomoniella chlamydospora]|uniref:DUF2293 domain-containing protein n=1 Tax=Phaeomoniella chlamydospora TaxID=158046 RepID=A0A0G2H1R8_PHACM|nr:hypothetical protein UCRPC4_g00054 [Phaeomoniella chlamydospora]
MARVERPPAAASTRPAAGSNDLVPVTKNRKHKVVLESVTQEKQRLRQTITFNAKPPLGYTFIPAGNPELTTALKEQSRKAGAKVYTVTTTPHANVHDLSQQVHRIGYHFSSLIVAEICHQFGIQLSASGHVVGNSYETFLKGYKGRGAPGAEEEGWDQTTLNTKARDAIKDLFPNIPDNDLYQIIKTAFQKGKKRVGTASELPLARRAQLAVVAHIRHCYTAYDRLLRNGGYHDARGVVEKPTLAKLVEWRGDDENGAKVLEDVFREVVVISDDEDSDDDDYDPEAPLKELSVEVLSRNANAVTSQMTPDQRHRISGHGETYTISDDDTPPGVQFIAQRSRRANDQSNNERRGQAHRQVWNAAREQFRAGPQRQQPSVQTPISQPAPVFTSHTGPSSIALLPRPPYDGFERHDVPIIEPRQRPPETIVGKDGTVYTRIVSPPRFLDVNSGNPAHHSATPYDPSRPFLPDNLQRSAPPIPSRINGLQTMQESYAPESEIPLPSIERDDPATTKAQVNRSHYTEPEYRTTPPPYRRPQDTSGFANSIERPPAKKRRYEDTFQTDQFVGAPFQGQSGPDHGNFPEHTVKRFQRIDLRDSPHFEDLRVIRSTLKTHRKVGILLSASKLLSTPRILLMIPIFPVYLINLMDV